MGVFKNEVGRPSNEVLKTRFILKLIGLVLVIGLSFVGGYKLSNAEFNSEEKKTTNETSKEDNTKKTISEKDAENMIVDIFGEDYYYSTYNVDLDSEVEKSFIAISNTKKSEKTYDIGKYFDAKYDNSTGKYSNKKNIYGVNYEFYYNGEFIEYDAANKVYKKYFGNNNNLLKDNIISEPRTYFYSKDLNIYAASYMIWGDGGHIVTGCILDAYELDGKTYVTVVYADVDTEGNEGSLHLIDGNYVTLTKDEMDNKDTYKKYQDKLEQRQFVFFKEDNLYKFEQIIEKQ